MAKKPDFDLSNPGGRPKEWLQRGREYDSEFSWWDDVKFTATPVLIVVGLLAAAGLVIYGLSHIGS